MSMSIEQAAGQNHKASAIGAENPFEYHAISDTEGYNRYMELNPLLGVKIIHLIDRTDLLKISNLVYGGREIVTGMYSSLQGQRQFMADIVS